MQKEILAWSVIVLLISSPGIYNYYKYIELKQSFSCTVGEITDISDTLFSYSYIIDGTVYNERMTYYGIRSHIQKGGKYPVIFSSKDTLNSVVLLNSNIKLSALTKVSVCNELAQNIELWGD